MNEYKITVENSKCFVLANGETTLGTLEYNSWFSFKASIRLNNKSVYDVDPKGFWGTTIEVREAEEVLIDFRMNWKGEILIHTRFNNNDSYYIFKHKGILKTEFVLVNSNEETLLHFHPDFKWKQFNYDYNVITKEGFEALDHKELMLLVAAHCANYFITIMAVAAT